MLYRNGLIYSLLLGSIVINAHALELKSAVQQTTLLELYTSEGCSSCPPAEAYLNTLKNDTRLWKSIVPVAFHVDYWDYLGWQDRFAKPEHRVRQEDYAAINKQNTIYTPAFFVNGKPWRRGLFGRDIETSENQTGVLQVVYEHGKIAANFNSSDKTKKHWTLHVTLLGLGLMSNIEAGENSGRHSAHEFVVLQTQSAVSNDGQWQMRMNTKNVMPAEQYALAAWVTKQNEPRPVQAVGGFLPQLD